MEIKQEKKSLNGLKLRKTIEKMEISLDKGIGRIKKKEFDDLQDVEDMLEAFSPVGCILKSESIRELGKQGKGKLKKIKSIGSGVVGKSQEFIVRSYGIDRQRSLK